MLVNLREQASSKILSHNIEFDLLLVKFFEELFSLLCLVKELLLLVYHLLELYKHSVNIITPQTRLSYS